MIDLNSTKKTWFKARYNWVEIFNDLNDSDLRNLILAMWQFAEDGTEPEAISNNLKLAWKLIKGELERDSFFSDCGRRGGGNPALKTNTLSKGVKRDLKGGSLEREDKNREEEKEEEDKNREEKKRNNNLSLKKPIPPTVEEVTAYCQERGNGISAEEFVDYYAARGWDLKPNQKMKDWKAAVRTWESKSRKGNDSQPAKNQFNSFPQRQYTQQDYADIEKRLLQKQYAGKE